MIPEHSTGVLGPFSDGVLGPNTKRVISDLQLTTAIKSMQTNTVGMADSFQKLSVAIASLRLREVAVALEKDVPPTTEEVRMQRLNLARIVRNRG